MQGSSGPFDSIETAQEYLRLLLDEIERTRSTVESDILATHGPDQSARIIQLVTYCLLKLSNHVRASLKILNDLGRLRTLLHGATCCTKTAVVQRDTIPVEEDTPAMPVATY